MELSLASHGPRLRRAGYSVIFFIYICHGGDRDTPVVHIIFPLYLQSELDNYYLILYLIHIE